MDQDERRTHTDGVCMASIHQLNRLLSDLRARLRDIYGGRLRGLYLFGSHARGEPDEESDVDVLIVLDDVASYREELDRTSFVISELSLSYDLSLSRVIVSEDRWLHSQDLFFENVRGEAVPA